MTDQPAAAATGQAQTAGDALDAWWNDDHFGDECRDDRHDETCVDAAFTGGYDAGYAAALLSRPTLSDEAIEHVIEKACGAAFQFRRTKNADWHPKLHAAIDAAIRAALQGGGE